MGICYILKIQSDGTYLEEQYRSRKNYLNGETWSRPDKVCEVELFSLVCSANSVLSSIITISIKLLLNYFYLFYLLLFTLFFIIFIYVYFVF